MKTTPEYFFINLQSLKEQINDWKSQFIYISEFNQFLISPNNIFYINFNNSIIEKIKLDCRDLKFYKYLKHRNILVLTHFDYDIIFYNINTKTKKQIKVDDFIENIFINSKEDIILINMKYKSIISMSINKLSFKNSEVEIINDSIITEQIKNIKCYIKSKNKLFVHKEDKLFYFYDIKTKTKKEIYIDKYLSKDFSCVSMNIPEFIIIKDRKSLITINYTTHKIEHLINDAHNHEINHMKKGKFNQNRILFTSDESGILKIWNVLYMNLIITIDTQSLILSMDYSNKYLFVLGFDYIVKVWDVNLILNKY